MGVNRYGGEHHQFLSAYALARLGIKSGSVDITLLCPPALFNELKPQMIKAYSAQGVEISLKGDKKPVKYPIIEDKSLRRNGQQRQPVAS